MCLQFLQQHVPEGPERQRPHMARLRGPGRDPLATVAGMLTWSCGTRMRPNGKHIQHRARSALVALFPSRRVQRSAAFQAAALPEAWRITSLACRNFRTSDLLVKLQFNKDSGEAAGAFVRKFWVEVQDDATHSFLAACPGLVLAAIQNICEFSHDKP